MIKLSFLSRSLPVCAALALGALATGCTHAATTPTPIVVTPDASGIMVSGRGEIEAVPNLAVLNIGVEQSARSVGEARSLAASAADRMHASLLANGVAKEDIKTTDLSISPRYDYPPNGNPIVNGYTVTNTVMVKLRDLDKASKTIDDAVDAGGDAARLNGIHFEIEEASELHDQARARAVEEARKKAEQLARLSGVTLGAPISVEEVAFEAPIVPGFYARAEDSAAATPIEPGTSKVHVDVRVRWTINPA